MLFRSIEIKVESGEGAVEKIGCEVINSNTRTVSQTFRFKTEYKDAVKIQIVAKSKSKTSLKAELVYQLVDNNITQIMTIKSESNTWLRDGMATITAQNYNNQLANYLSGSNNRFKEGKCTAVRGTVYTVCIFLTEFGTGSLLKKHDLCPWDYSKSKANIKGLIRLDYAPLDRKSVV